MIFLHIIVAQRFSSYLQYASPARATTAPLGISCFVGHQNSLESHLDRTVDCFPLLAAYTVLSGPVKVRPQERGFQVGFSLSLSSSECLESSVQGLLSTFERKQRATARTYIVLGVWSYPSPIRAPLHVFHIPPSYHLHLLFLSLSPSAFHFYYPDFCD